MEGGAKVVGGVDGIEKSDKVSPDSFFGDGGAHDLKRKYGEAEEGDEKPYENARKAVEEKRGILMIGKIEKPRKPKDIACKIDDDKFFHQRDPSVDGERQGALVRVFHGDGDQKIKKGVEDGQKEHGEKVGTGHKASERAIVKCADAALRACVFRHKTAPFLDCYHYT